MVDKEKANNERGEEREREREREREEGGGKLEGDTRGRERVSRYRAIETASEIYEINLARPHSAETMQCPVYGRWRG